MSIRHDCLDTNGKRGARCDPNGEWGGGHHVCGAENAGDGMQMNIRSHMCDFVTLKFRWHVRYTFLSAVRENQFGRLVGGSDQSLSYGRKMEEDIAPARHMLSSYTHLPHTHPTLSEGGRKCEN